MAKKAENLKKTDRFAQIKSDLLYALERVGRRDAHDTDLVDSYMDLWCHYQMLKEDVNERGVYISYNNGGGQTGTKRNDSLQDELKVSAQMLKIREALGIKDIPSDAGDEYGP